MFDATLWPEAECPWCEALSTEFTVRPSSGDAIVCWRCGGVSLFNATGLVRAISTERACMTAEVVTLCSLVTDSILKGTGPSEGFEVIVGAWA